MCASAIVLARLPGWCSAPPTQGRRRRRRISSKARLNHRPQVESSLGSAEDCADLLRSFFAPRR